MAIYTITADLNGGDETTLNNDLTYKIYSGSDTLIKTVGSHESDANVTVAGDTVTIENVDTTSTDFKITSVDEAGNESIKSDAMGTNFGLNFSGDIPGEGGKGGLVNQPNTGDATIECRWKQDSGNTLLKVFFGIGVVGGIGNSKGGISMLMNSEDAEMRFAIGDGVDASNEIEAIPNDGEYHLYKIVATSNGAYECFIDDVSVATGATAGGALADSTNVFIGNSGAATEGVKGTLDWVKVNNELFELNEGVGASSFGSEGTEVILTGNPTWVNI